MTKIRFLLAAAFAATLVLDLAANPAAAAEPVFPPGLRVGLVPLDGLVPAKDFAGFESSDKTVKVGIIEVPETAFAAVEAAVKEGKPVTPKPQAMQTVAGPGYFTMESAKEGSANIKNFSLIVSGKKFAGYVITQLRDGAEKKYSDDAVRQMLASTATRPEAPVSEQLDLVPFKVSELANFKTVRTLAPRASILLTDGDEDTQLDGAPYMVIGLMQGAPETPDDRARFARQVAATIPGLREARITSSEPMRIDGTPGFETRIDAVSGKNDTPVTVVQWLRFGSGSATLRIIAGSTRTDWPQAFTRFRAVRDGIGPR